MKERQRRKAGSGGELTLRSHNIPLTGLMLEILVVMETGL